MIINRSLVYGVLTVTLVLAYVASVVVLQALFRALTDQSSQLAVVLSTLAIVALFNPLRRRIQASISHRFQLQEADSRSAADQREAR